MRFERLFENQVFLDGLHVVTPRFRIRFSFLFIEVEPCAVANFLRFTGFVIDPNDAQAASAESRLTKKVIPQVRGMGFHSLVILAIRPYEEGGAILLYKVLECYIYPESMWKKEPVLGK